MTLKITWLGSATFTLEDQAGHRVFVDPWLDAPPGNPGCPVKASAPGRADLVLVTHGDPAHYGRGDAPKVAAAAGCRFVSNPAVCQYVVGKGLLPQSQVLPLTLDQTYDLGCIEVTQFPIIHPPYTEPIKSDIPNTPNTGFALTMGGVSVLYVGDTVLGDEVYRRVGAAHRLLIGLLPIFTPASGRGTPEQSVDEALGIVKMTGLTYVIPHYRYVPDNPTAALLRAAMRPLGVEVPRLEPGGSFSLDG